MPNALSSDSAQGGYQVKKLALVHTAARGSSKGEKQPSLQLSCDCRASHGEVRAGERHTGGKLLHYSVLEGCLVGS